MQSAIYLDHNATTPVLPEVGEAMRACWAQPLLNPASQHGFGRAARRAVEDARERIGELLGAGPADRVVFTSGGTEANNLAVSGLCRVGTAHQLRDQNSPKRAGDLVGSAHPTRVIVSTIEHPSVAALVEQLERSGYDVARLGADRNGVIRAAELGDLLQARASVVAAMLANNETGVVQPVAELAAIFGENGVPLHTDAAQAAGKLPIDFRKLGAATLTIAAHKFGGPVGIGALLVRNDIELQPQLFGGFQQAGTRPGTEAVALAVGMRTALELWEANRAMWTAHLRQLRDHFEEQLLAAGALESCRPVVIGASAERLPHTSNIAFVGLDRQQLFLALDQAGVACSTGSACASGSSEPSPAHLAMGLDAGVISSALRFSFGVSTTREEVAEATCRIIKVCNHLRR
jgi:cysteine desulfurase